MARHVCLKAKNVSLLSPGLPDASYRWRKSANSRKKNPASSQVMISPDPLYSFSCFLLWLALTFKTFQSLITREMKSTVVFHWGLALATKLESVTCRLTEYGHSQFDGCFFNVLWIHWSGGWSCVLSWVLRLKVDSMLNSSVTCLKLAEHPFGRLLSMDGHSKVPRRWKLLQTFFTVCTGSNNRNYWLSSCWVYDAGLECAVTEVVNIEFPVYCCVVDWYGNDGDWCLEQ